MVWTNEKAVPLNVIDVNNSLWLVFNVALESAVFVALYDTVVFVDVEPDGSPFVLESINRLKEIFEISKKCLV